MTESPQACIATSVWRTLFFYLYQCTLFELLSRGNTGTGCPKMRYKKVQSLARAIQSCLCPWERYVKVFRLLLASLKHQPSPMGHQGSYIPPWHGYSPYFQYKHPFEQDVAHMRFGTVSGAVHFTFLPPPHHSSTGDFIFPVGTYVQCMGIQMVLRI